MSIEAALQGCGAKPLAEAATELFDVLGYRSEKRLSLKPNTPDNFLQTFVKNQPFNRDHALLDEWRSVDFLFQLTDDEVRAVALDDKSLLFQSKGEYEGAIVESYLFFAVELNQRRYTRTELSGITRAVNRLFSMPVFLLFRHGDTVTLAVIRRRLHKHDESKDVLEKVTLIKDIVFADPIRAHLDILHDLALPVLYDEYRFHSFVGLHQAWEKRLGSYALNERFYREIAAWYFWALAHQDVTLPRAIENLRDKDEREKQRSVFFIRLLTRLIFCWFLQEKRLIPRDLFRSRMADGLLKDPSPKAGTYYRAFLQNLFFATLNQEQEKRGWRKEYGKSTRKGNRGATNLWRYRGLLQDPAQLESLLRDHIPFVNGGLFDCLDQVFQEKEDRDDIRLDDFSEEKANSLCLPNELFFGEEREMDLSGVYDDQRRKREKVRGLIETLSRYKFTVEENTPLEEEIALDPELLGKVFENLLASYNEDTRTTARKALGGFYTPREIVSYMVDEALIAFLQTALTASVQAPKSENQNVTARLRSLFTAHPATLANPFSPNETATLIAAIGRVKILDPACGSGAFPMGALHRLVDLLQKLDPNNESWKRDRLTEAERYRDILRQSDASREEVDQCEARIEDIRKSFDTRYHALDFARKLYIIENSIYGVDIQPIATQIAKLRFFIALIVDQQVRPSAPNLGVRPLPNLETKIVAADALIPLEKPQMDLLETEILPLRRQLKRVRHDHFNARTPSAKAGCRQRDAELRMKIAELLKQNGLPAAAANALAAWNPYDQNHAAPFFDPEWMFDLTTNGNKDAGAGFDVVLGNPPYVRQEQIKQLKPLLKQYYDCFTGTADLYVYFYERSVRLLKPGGVFAFITSNKWFRSGYGAILREWLSHQTRILKLIDFGDAPVFAAIAYPCIIILQRSDDPQARDTNEIEAFSWQPGSLIERFADVFATQHFLIPQESLMANGWSLENDSNRSLLERIRSAGTPLAEYCGDRIYRGILTGLNEAFIVDQDTRDRLIKQHKSSAELLKLFVRGRDVKRWRVEYDHQYLIKIESSENRQHPWSGKKADEAEKIFAKKYPAIHEHFESLRRELIKRHDKGHYFWELRACVYYDAFEQPKIIYPDIYERQSFTWDNQGYFAGNTCYFIPTPEKWLAGLLNSLTIEWFYGHTSNRIRGGYLRAFTEYMGRIPIPAADHKQRDLISSIVEYLQLLSSLAASCDQGSANPRDPLMLGYWEQLLNGLVYELFFPVELHSRGLRLFDLTSTITLPDVNALSRGECLSHLRTEFERTYATDHPLRGALSTLRSLEIVRTIEGDS